MSDLAGRVGSYDFAVASMRGDERTARALTRKLERLINAAEMSLGRMRGSLQARIGTVVYRDGEEPAGGLLAAAAGEAQSIVPDALIELHPGLDPESPWGEASVIGE